MRRLSIMVLMSAALLAACGGKTLTGVGNTTGGGGGGGGGTTKTVVSLGSGSGAGFQSGAIAISTASLSAGGSTSLQVSLVDQKGNLYTQSSTITFASPCAGQGLATITVPGVTPASSTVTTTTGTATATYAAKGCNGSDVISASASANSQTLSASGTVTVAQAAIGSIQFVSATPSNITLKGVGSAGGSATSAVIFKVLDTSGGPRAGASVTFALNTSVGGITIAPATATTDANGLVQTIVSGGTVATTVRITATTTVSGGSTISTQSTALTVSTGIPTSNNISLAVLCPNVEAWDVDGVNVPVTVAMTDRFSNPVPDGTTANFVTTLGGIDATCQTGTGTGNTGPGSGACSVNWHSKAPRVVSGDPRTTMGTLYTNTAEFWCGPTTAPYCTGTTNGRSPIVVTAIGEETFVDANGNGTFDAGDTVGFNPNNKDNNFANGTPKPWDDTQEPFLNQWEIYDTYGTPVFIPGDFFIDFNKNGTHDGPDGAFNGPLCQGSLCSATQTSVSIGKENVIVLSGSHANATVVGGIPSGGFVLPTTIFMYIYDDRFQQMPNGSTITVSFSTNAGQLDSPAPAAWPCSSATPVFDTNGKVVSAGLLFGFSASPPKTGFQAGNMFVSIKTPLGLITTFAVPVFN